MGKWGVLFTFLLSLALITAGWYLLRPADPAPPVEPDAGGGIDSEDRPEVVSAVAREFTGLVLARATATPISNAQVVAGAHETRTDDDGGWSLSLPVREGAEETYFDLQVRADGYLTGHDTVEYDPMARSSRDSIVRLNRAAKRIVGRVFDHRGMPVAGATVSGLTTNELGRFGPLPVALGKLTLVAVTPGRPDGMVHLVIGPLDPAERTVVINLPEPDPLTVLVTDAEGSPLSGVEIRKNRHEDPIGRTDESGTFGMKVARGTGARLLFAKERYRTATRTIDAGQRVEVRLERGILVAGRVTLSDGTPVGAGLTVEDLARDVGRILPPTRTDGVGRFRLTVAAGDAVRLRVRWRNAHCGEFELPVAGGMDLTGVELTLAKPAFRTVVVRFEKLETAIEGAEVIGGWPDPTARSVTDEEGKAKVPVPPKGVLHPGGVVPVRVCHADFVEEFARIHLDDEREVFVKLSQMVAVIVDVVDASDRPVPGATVRVSAGRRMRASGRTDADGRIGLPAPHFRDFVVLASHPVHGRVEEKGRLYEMRLVLEGPPPPWVLDVRDGDGNAIFGALVEPTEAVGLRSLARFVPQSGRSEIPSDVSEVRVSAPGYETVLVRASGDKPAAVTLRPGIDLTIEVRDGKGHPITNAAVEAFGADDLEVAAGRARVDSRGVAVLRGVPADTAIRLRAIGFGGWETRQFWTRPGERQVSVALARFGRIHVTFPTAAAGDRIESIIRALDRPITDMEYRRHDNRRLAEAGSEFRYGAPAGPVAIWFRCGKGGWQVWPRVEVPETGQLDLTYTAPAPGRLTLDVKNVQGAHIDAARVFACGVGQHLAWTSPVGRIPDAKAPDIPNGLVRLFIRHEKYSTVVTEPLDLARGAELEVTMRSGGEVGGVLLDRAGKRVRGRVRALIHSGYYEDWVKTDDDGEFRVPGFLSEGRHRFEVRAPGRVPVLREVSVTAGTRNRVELRVD